MKEFMFYTYEGYTFSPSGADEDIPDCENMQILGTEKGRTSSSAFKKLLKSNSWIKKLGFDEVESVEIVGKKEFHFV